MEKIKRLLAVFLVVFFGFLSSQTWAQEKTPVKLLFNATLSGKVGALPEEVWGAVDGAEYINERGGINGRKYEILVEDAQYDVAVAVSIYNRVVSAQPKNELLFRAGNGTHILLALAEKVKEDRIVCLDGSLATQIFNENVKKNYPYYFSTSVNVGDQIGHLFKFIKDTLHKGEGQPKVALLYIDEAAGRDPLKIVEMFAKKFGIDLVMVEPVPMTVTDFATHMIKIRNSKADHVIFFSWVIPATTRFLKTAKTYIPNAKLLGINFSSYEIFFETAGESYDNFYATSFFPKPYETDNPLIKILLDTVEKKGRKIKIWDGYLRTWLTVSLCAEAARRADNAGNLTREGVLLALEKMDNWTAHGMYAGKPLYFHNHSLSIGRIVRADFKSQRLIPVTDWVKVSDYLK